MFIPGNAGSSHQVRSIASSAARQYYSSPFEVSTEFSYKDVRALDFFAVEFNEDLSAFHGTTLENQKKYTERAIDYILSLYPPNTSVIVIGHSMGGIVATSLLPHSNISAIITMSTPHTLPPARFDRRIDQIYNSHKQTLDSDPTPILSLCGGATDLMIPSESCILPFPSDLNTPYRRTIFTSALEGSWTGVGHREMVWCHQVRWRVARAALELGAASSTSQRGVVLDTWLRDGHILPPGIASKDTDAPHFTSESVNILSPNSRLVSKFPSGTQTHLLPIPHYDSGFSPAFVVYVSGGGIPPVAPHHSFPFRVSLYHCKDTSPESCSRLPPNELKLLPTPIPGASFPIPGEGSDESEGVVMFSAALGNRRGYVGVQIQYGDGRGWVVGGFVESVNVRNHAGPLSPFYSTLSTRVDGSDPLHSAFLYPNLMSSALLVYRVTGRMGSNCSGTQSHNLLESYILR